MIRRSLHSYIANFQITKHADRAYTSKADTRLNALDMGIRFYKNIKRHNFYIDYIYSYNNKDYNNRFKI